MEKRFRAYVVYEEGEQSWHLARRARARTTVDADFKV